MISKREAPVRGTQAEGVKRIVDTVVPSAYSGGVVAGFRHKGLEEIYLAGRTRRIVAEHVRKCVRILQLLEVAARPEALNIAGYRFHGLHGNPQRWSVRVTGNLRITFGWSGEHAREVDLDDCH